MSNHETGGTAPARSGFRIGLCRHLPAATGVRLARVGRSVAGGLAILLLVGCSSLPVIEVHLSNIYRREEYRHHSYISRAATGVICGLGAHGYELAIDAMAKILDSRKTK
mgnify:CR=1 FL=1